MGAAECVSLRTGGGASLFYLAGVGGVGPRGAWRARCPVGGRAGGRFVRRGAIVFVCERAAARPTSGPLATLRPQIRAQRCAGCGDSSSSGHSGRLAPSQRSGRGKRERS